MIIKWIVCKVPHNKKIEFSSAQEQWKALKGVDGFIGQIGGWDVKQNSDACVLGLWEDLESYKHFMNNEHDEICNTSNQNQSYESISVTLFEKRFDVQGQNHKTDVSHLTKGTILRVEDTTTYENRSEQFIEAQSKIWKQGIVGAKGMCYGLFSKDTLTLNRYVNTTVWEDERSHQEYVDNVLPLLWAKADFEKDVSFIHERLILLNDRWSVV